MLLLLVIFVQCLAYYGPSPPMSLGATLYCIYQVHYNISNTRVYKIQLSVLFHDLLHLTSLFTQVMCAAVVKAIGSQVLHRP